MDENKIEELLEQNKDNKDVLYKIVLDNKLIGSLRDKALDLIFSNKIIVKYNLEHKTLNRITDKDGQDVTEFSDLISIEISDSAFKDMNIINLISEVVVFELEGNRVDSNFLLNLREEEKEEEKVIKFFGTEKVLDFTKRAIAAAVLFSVVSGVGAKAFAADKDLTKESSAKYEKMLDNDEFKTSEKRLLKNEIHQISNKVVALDFNLRNESKIEYQKISSLMNQEIDEVDDLNSESINIKIKSLSQEDKNQLYTSLVKIKSEIESINSFKEEVKTVYSDFKNKISNYEKKIELLSLENDENLKNDFNKIKNNPKNLNYISLLNKIDKLESDLDKLKDIRNKILFND